MEDLLVRAATLVAVALATFSSFPGSAQQQQDTTTQQPAMQQSQQPGTQQGSPIPPVAPTATPQNSQQDSSNAISPAAAQLKPVTGELVDRLDSKSAKQGDSVVIKTDENLQISQGTEIPRGSKLIGHVTNVQPRGDGKENSQIAIQFDRAELKGGQTLPIESVIQSVTPAGDTSATSGISTPPSAYGSNTSSSMPTGSMGSTGSGTGTMNQNTANGSMNQSTANGTMNQNTMDNNRPSMGSNSTAQPGQPAMGSQSGMAAQNDNGMAAAPGSIVARNGNVAIRTTSVPGVLLANDIHGLPFSNASGLLLGARRDVRLDQGTKFVLAVAMAPQGAGSGMNR